MGEAGTSLADVLRKEHIDQFNMQIPQQAEMSRILGGVSSAHVNDAASARTNSLVGKVQLSLEQTRAGGAGSLRVDIRFPWTMAPRISIVSEFSGRFYVLFFLSLYEESPIVWARLCPHSRAHRRTRNPGPGCGFRALLSTTFSLKGT